MVRQRTGSCTHPMIADVQRATPQFGVGQTPLGASDGSRSDRSCRDLGRSCLFGWGDGRGVVVSQMR
jgi:hypothetical protein